MSDPDTLGGVLQARHTGLLGGTCTLAYSHTYTQVHRHMCARIQVHTFKCSHAVGECAFSLAWTSFEKPQSLIARHRKTWHRVVGEMFHGKVPRTFLKNFPCFYSAAFSISFRQILFTEVKEGRKQTKISKEVLMNLEKEEMCMCM